MHRVISHRFKRISIEPLARPVLVYYRTKRNERALYRTGLSTKENAA